MHPYPDIPSQLEPNKRIFGYKCTAESKRFPEDGYTTEGYTVT